MAVVSIEERAPQGKRTGVGSNRLTRRIDGLCKNLAAYPTVPRGRSRYHWPGVSRASATFSTQLGPGLPPERRANRLGRSTETVREFASTPSIGSRLSREDLRLRTGWAPYFAAGRQALK
jgi:hypothetical protein